MVEVCGATRWWKCGEFWTPNVINIDKVILASPSIRSFRKGP